MAQHEYRARIHWERGAAAFTDNRFSRAHRWHFDGGIEVPASSSPHVVRVPLSDEHAVDPDGRNAAGRTAMVRVTLRPRVVFSGERLPQRADIDSLHHRSHEECFIANSVTTEVSCEPVWDG